MATGLEGGYAPPGIYTETFFGVPPSPAVVPPSVPIFIGTGREILTRTNLPLVRGSSATVDTLITEEDEAGRAVVSVNPDGSITLGSFDGLLSTIQVRNFPLVSGAGTGTVATDTSAVSVTINGTPVVVLSLSAATGRIELSQAPLLTDTVRCTYYFDRTDTLGTDTVSSQVTATAAILEGLVGQNYVFTAGFNDTFSLSVDGGAFFNVTLPSSAPSFTASVVIATINGAAGTTSLVASSFVDNYGATCVRLTADKSLAIGTGTANTVLGFIPGATTSRNRTFYTFNGPIVNGNGGGVTTTNPSDVTVLVDGVQVVPTAVDGANRSVTLPTAPKVGAVVTVRYYWNTWQDTFDYLANTGVTTIDTVGLTPDASVASTYINGVSYVLKDDRILWGTASLISSGLHTEGGTTFGTSQVSALLVDNQVYMSPCAAAVDTSGPVSVASQTVFQLAFQPTTGNGRGNPLGSTTYNTVANGRMDFPTTQPGVVSAYWGYGVQDALTRGTVTVLKVDPVTSQITLALPVPEGAQVFATYYYNTLVDQAFIGSSRGYTLTVIAPGAGGVGTYGVKKGDNSSLYGVILASKGADLATVTVNFPSGSEFFPDARIEGGAPVDETITVRFATSDATPARFVNFGPGPYNFITGASDHLRVTFDGSDQQTGLAAGIDLASPTGSSRLGVFASLLSNEVAYTAASGEVTYDITAAVDDNINLLVDGVNLSATAVAGAGVTVANYVTAINAAAAAANPYYTSAGSFPNGYTVTASQYDRLSFHYTGNVAGASGVQVITLAAAAYTTVALLVAQINTQLAVINAGGGLLGSVACTATADAKLRFTLTLAAGDAAGYLELTTTAGDRDFAVIAGLSTAAATNGTQTKLYQGPIARRFTVATTSGRLPYDRIVLRNRIFPGTGTVSPWQTLGQTGLLSQGGTGATKAGLPAGAYGEATTGAVVRSPSILGVVGWAGGIGAFGADARTGQPVVTFYDGTDPLFAVNNVFSFVVNGTTVTTTFTASATGTITALGPATTATTVLGQIRARLTVLGLATTIVLQEGDGFRIEAPSTVRNASVVIGSGSANGVLVFSAGDSAGPTPVTVEAFASTLMSHAQAAGSFSTFMMPFTVGAAGYFTGRALAGVESDATNNKYLYLQSLTLGASSSISLKTPTSLSALASGTGFLSVAGSGSSGRATINGFFVTSSNPSLGSGSANTSVFNAGVGQDGVVGQTYVDDVTGLTFTILPRSGGIAYPVTATSTLSLRSSQTLRTDGNIPVLAIPGLELTVTNTQGIVVGDTALVETFKKDGPEPSIGEVYYASYQYSKRDFTARLYSRLSDVVSEYGPVSPDNPLSLAAYFAFLNGSSVIGTLQVAKQAGSSSASEATYIAAIDAVAGKCLPGNLSPSVVTLLTPATQTLAVYMARHCDVQSSIRYQAERTSIFGFASGTRPDQAMAISAATGASRVRFVYPDIATITLTDVLNTSRNYLVDGRYLAVAVTASTTSPTVDSATPWESRQLVGFTSLNRRLDAVTANQTANGGITILEDRAPFLRIRHGLTSDMSNILMKTPTIIQVADDIQRRIRAVLGIYTGTKFLPQILGQIEGRLAEMFKQAIQEQIITAFTGIRVSLDPEDPTAILVEAFYQPVFPLLYIMVTLRVSAR